MLRIEYFIVNIRNYRYNFIFIEKTNFKMFGLCKIWLCILFITASIASSFGASIRKYFIGIVLIIKTSKDKLREIANQLLFN